MSRGLGLGLGFLSPAAKGPPGPPVTSPISIDQEKTSVSLIDSGWVIPANTFTLPTDQLQTFNVSAF